MRATEGYMNRRTDSRGYKNNLVSISSFVFLNPLELKYNSLKFCNISILYKINGTGEGLWRVEK